MVVMAFLITDQANCVRFLEETFLVANVSPEVVLGMSFDVRAQKIDGSLFGD